MQFSSLFLAAAALITGSQAAAIPRQSDPHIVDFRTFGQPGCSADNQGIYTYTQSMLDTCYTFGDLNVESIFVADITEGCSGKPKAPSPSRAYPLDGRYTNAYCSICLHGHGLLREPNHDTSWH